MIIAIDGPSGAGKTTVAKTVAKKLNFHCLDTGAMYRCVAWQAFQNGISFDDAASLEKIARTYTISFSSDPALGEEKVYMNGVDVTSEIRKKKIDDAVSLVAAVPGVRQALIVQQRRITQTGNYVVEGRDIGTTVFPSADVKVFLTASDEARAHRRVRQNVDRGIGSINYSEVLANLRRRDDIDSHRAASPLRKADDAVVIDSTHKFIEQVIEEICTLAHKKIDQQ